ncbi:MAG: sugar ABC transporter ATP-binding protein [Solirubrobacterales bacterium]
MSEPRLVAKGLSKTFGGTAVLTDVDLTVGAGEVHGLIGQNGSGKSTLIKLLSGFHTPDAGEVTVDGEQLHLPADPKQLQEHGVSFVHQDLGLVPSLSVAENVRVGRFRVGRLSRRVDWRHERAAVAETFERLRVDIPLEAPVSEFTTSQRAVIALARALQGYRPGHGVIVLDESTQALPRETLPEFYAMIRELSAEGTSFIVVSHRLDEIMRMTDRVTVLRDGRVVAEAQALNIAETSTADLAKAMLGATLEAADMREVVPAAPVEEGGAAAVFSEVRGGYVEDVSFAVRPGEVLGITGLTDSGVGDLPYLICGAKPAAGGSVKLADGRRLDLAGADVRELLDAGILLVPADRAGAGVAMTVSALDNLTLATIGEQRGAWISRRRQQAEFDRMAEELDIRPRSSEMALARFSGGNQQKILLGKWLLRDPRLLVLHEPTQAVDVGARRDLLLALRKRAQRGAAVVICSVEPEDLAQVCDRVLVLGGGRVHGEVKDGLTAEAIGERIWEAGTVALAEGARVG